MQAAPNNSYPVSRYIHLDFLLSKSEMELLLSDLGDFSLFQTGKVLGEKDVLMPLEAFIAHYVQYIEGGRFDPILMTTDVAAIEKVSIGEDRFLIKPIRPLIQLRAFSYTISHDGRIQSMVFGPTSINWGIRASFPGLFIDPETKSVVEVLRRKEDPNVALFFRLQRWLRNYSRPAVLEVDGKKVYATFRKGIHGS